ncbi:flagellar assembly factor FliW [Anaerospora hongkongensis]|uniref:Flagellar assembly factor FliW n=1 Tax=Anaerospora hongkongensis TaxID=244830 RepID=A0A4R1Q410_9FIRM|nr:flagellar assembly protein FliW [Anaerospora hongkongensis]TCL36115.1 flagellar assembly factor FliW [Anaerospora hongkongensis]
MKILSTRFGELEISSENILHFEQGIPGFPDENEFAFLPYETGSPFGFLQSTHDADLTFLIVEPFSFLPEYTFELSDEWSKEIGISAENPPQIFNIVSIKEPLQQSTVNLLAPVVVNWRDRKAKQIILEKVEYTTKQLLFPNGLPDQKTQGGK